jgi:hypothetical protein
VAGDDFFVAVPRGPWPRLSGGFHVRSSLLTLLLVAGFTTSLILLGTRLCNGHLPGNQQGYAPVQPIAFSHRMHAGELQISCLYCHTGAERSPHAGLPASNICMNCHRFVTAPFEVVRAEAEEAQQARRPPRRIVSPEMLKLYDALGLDGQIQTDPGKPQRPIAWLKVHNLPAYTRFDHHAHVHAGVECASCHGAVEKMDRVEQVSDLSMGWCVNCHREKRDAAHKPATATDCATCHH